MAARRKEAVGWTHMHSRPPTRSDGDRLDAKSDGGSPSKRAASSGNHPWTLMQTRWTRLRLLLGARIYCVHPGRRGGNFCQRSLVQANHGRTARRNTEKEPARPSIDTGNASRAFARKEAQKVRTVELTAAITSAALRTPADGPLKDGRIFRRTVDPGKHHHFLHGSICGVRIPTSGAVFSPPYVSGLLNELRRGGGGHTSSSPLERHTCPEASK